MACLRCRLKPIAKNNYGSLIEYTHPLPEKDPDPVVFELPAHLATAGFKPTAQLCRCCGTVYCEPVAPPAPAPGLAPRR